MNEDNADRNSLLLRIAVIVADIQWYGALLGAAIVLILMVMNLSGVTYTVPGVPLSLKFAGGVLGPVEYLSGAVVLDLEKPVINWVLIGFFPIGLLYLIVPYMLRKIVRSARDGNPFTLENVRRIRWIGSLIMLSGPLSSLMNYLFYLNYRQCLDIPGVEVEPNLDITTIINLLLLGLLILVLAQVFDKGVRLQQDSDLTV